MEIIFVSIVIFSDDSSIIIMRMNSTAVSREIANFIVDNAKKAHRYKLRTIALERYSHNTASKYPTDCYSHLMQAYSGTPSQQHRDAFDMYPQLPQSPTYRGTFTHTSPVATPSSSLLKHLSKSIARSKGRASHQPSKTAGKCVRVEAEEECDQ